MLKLFIFFLLISFNSFSQTKETSIDDKYFILGTLDDYLGRGFYSSISDHVDYYYLGEEPLIKYIGSLLQANKIKYKITTEPNRTYIISKTFSKELNSFYDFKYDSTEINTKKDKWEKSYRGYLKDSIFHDSSEIYSFLLGAYVRYGSAMDTANKIQIGNSLTKSQTCLKLLKDIGCEDVSIKYTQSIPTQVVVYFKPTKKLEEMIKNFKPLMKELNDSRNLFYKKFLGDSSDNKK